MQWFLWVVSVLLVVGQCGEFVQFGLIEIGGSVRGSYEGFLWCQGLGVDMMDVFVLLVCVGDDVWQVYVDQFVLYQFWFVGDLDVVDLLVVGGIYQL